jgi:cytochrome c peroxidase
MTPAKVQLGKALFFEEQLSSDDTMACATCHLPEAGGTDPRAGARAPGGDGLMNTPDDEFGSPGVVLQDAAGDYRSSPVFGVDRQVTGRNAPTVIGAAFFNTQFWDARAGPEFRDLDGRIVLREFASLESQAVEPPLSAVEMGHAQRDWREITAKFARVRPLALASDLPPALEQFIGDSATYSPLFQLAFGDDAITRERIAMAIATYERTLVPDHAPFDLGTMTARQRRGLAVFNREGCQVCHTVSNGLFSDGSLQSLPFRLHERPVKVPTLRNGVLKKRFMSNGLMTSMLQVLQFYEQVGLFFPTPTEVGDVRDFLENALTDPRVAARQPPFDRPTLRSERAPHGANLLGTATPGSAGLTPLVLADSPPYLGNPDFKIGLGAALGGKHAAIFVSTRQAGPGATMFGTPIAIDTPFRLYQTFRLPGALPGEGVATFHAQIPASAALVGKKLYAQWFVRDPGAATGVSASAAAEFEFFAPR